MDFKIKFLFPPEKDIDPFLELRLEQRTCYGAIETLNWREIFVMIHNIARQFKTPEKIIEKLNYTMCHELIHGLLESRDEKLVHELTYALVGFYLKETQDFYPRKQRELAKHIVPVIDFTSPSFSETMP